MHLLRIVWLVRHSNIWECNLCCFSLFHFQNCCCSVVFLRCTYVPFQMLTIFLKSNESKLQRTISFGCMRQRFLLSQPLISFISRFRSVVLPVNTHLHSYCIFSKEWCANTNSEPLFASLSILMSHAPWQKEMKIVSSARLLVKHTKKPLIIIK